MRTAACSRLLPQLPGGPLDLELHYNWDFAGTDADQVLHPDLTASVMGGSGKMTGTVSSFFLTGLPAVVNQVALGSQWGSSTDGVYGKYSYGYLSVYFPLYYPDPPPVFPYTPQEGTLTVNVGVSGIFANLDRQQELDRSLSVSL